jgi:hypothetical protein
MNKDKLIGLVWAVVICAIISLCSCTTTRYVTVPEYHFRDSTKLLHVHDSVYSRDSIFVYTKGDTVYHEHYNVKYKEYFRNDTINVIREDSIRVPYPVEKRITVHKMYTIEKIFMWIGIISILALIVFIIIKAKRGVRL